MPASTLTPLTIEKFREHIRSVSTANEVLATCAHHTWSPNTSEWNGRRSMESIRRYHMESRGFSDIAANFYVAPDGFVWTARPLSKSNWAHAYISKDWSAVHPDVVAFAKGDRGALNKHAVGIEIVGNYDQEPLGDTLELALDVFAAMHERWSIPINRLFFHRMVADKTCPGSSVELDWFRNNVESRMLGEPVDTCPEWAKEARDWAVDNNITDGSRPNDMLTRAEAWTMLHRAKESGQDG